MPDILKHPIAIGWSIQDATIEELEKMRAQPYNRTDFNQSLDAEIARRREPDQTAMPKPYCDCDCYVAGVSAGRTPPDTVPVPVELARTIEHFLERYTWLENNLDADDARAPLAQLREILGGGR